MNKQDSDSNLSVVSCKTTDNIHNNNNNNNNNNLEAERVSKEVIQQLAKENFNPDNPAHIDPLFYERLTEDDRGLAHKIARLRLAKLRKFDFDSKNYDRLAKQEIGLLEIIKSEISKFFHLIDNIKPVENTELEEKFKDVLEFDCERVGPFSTFASYPCRHCVNGDHIKCTSAVLTKAIPDYKGEQHCQCFRLFRSKHNQVKEFVPKGLFKKENYSEGDGSALIIDDNTKEVIED